MDLIDNSINHEYKRLKSLFSLVDESKTELVDNLIYQLLYYLEYQENYQNDLPFANTKLNFNFAELISCSNTLNLVLSDNQVSITQLECFFVPYQLLNPEVSSELVRLVFEHLSKKQLRP